MIWVPRLLPRLLTETDWPFELLLPPRSFKVNEGRSNQSLRHDTVIVEPATAEDGADTEKADTLYTKRVTKLDTISVQADKRR